jgi:phosphate transport system protein
VRAAYHEELTALTEQLGQMCGLAGVAMERATQALLQADLLLAEQVIAEHDQITAMSAQAAERAFVLLALQAPVAGDLRAIIGAIQIAANIDRMGALALRRVGFGFPADHEPLGHGRGRVDPFLRDGGLVDPAGGLGDV